MAKKGLRSEASPLLRREVLSALALAAGFLASVSLLGRLLSRDRRPDPKRTPLPGEGSIFQPRRDARLEEWEQRHRR